MRDASSGENMVVHTDGIAGAYLIVPLVQMEIMSGLLSRNCVLFSIDRNAVSLGGRETDVVFNFGTSADIQRIHNILDSVE
jgi:hypothetical protein